MINHKSNSDFNSHIILGRTKVNILELLSNFVIFELLIFHLDKNTP